MKRLLLPVLLFVVATGCGDAQPDAVTDSVAPTEVVVVGTQPFITDMPDGYTPGHLRALLDKIKPDLIAIEAATNVSRPMASAPYECRHVTIPWAREHEIPVVAVGLLEKDYGPQIEAMKTGLRAEGRDAAFEIIEEQLQRRLHSMGRSIDALNTEDWQQAWRTYHDQLHRLVGADTPWEVWNERVARKLRKLCEDNPGKRIAVVFGAGHTYYFRDALAELEAVDVKPTAALLPLSDSDVDRHTTRLDYLKALRPLNTAAVSPEALLHCEHLLRHLKGLPDMALDYQLFEGKLQLHAGKYQQAVSAFDHLAESAAGAISQFDGRHRIVDGARLGAVLALRADGRTREAADRLRIVLADSQIAPEVRQFAQEMLNQIADTSLTSAGLSR